MYHYTVVTDMFYLFFTLYTRVYNRDVNRAEISGPARPAKIFRPGPESMYYKICTENCFWNITSKSI